MMDLQEAISALGKKQNATEEDVEYYANKVAKSTGLPFIEIARELRESALYG